MSYFPMMIELQDRPVLVIGAGEEGTKKVEVLSKFGCKITLVAKEANADAIKLSYEFINREFRDSDINDSYAMVVAATENEGLNRRISEIAKSNKIPVNIVDNVELCTFIFPAIIKENDVVISVSSGGKSPYVAQHIKAIIREHLPNGIGVVNDKMGELREGLKRTVSDRTVRNKRLKEKLNELLGVSNKHTEL